MLLSFIAVAFGGAPSPFTFTLGNAAEAGMVMPPVGIGTGSYSNDKPGDPTCWSCPNVTYNAIKSYLAAGGRRIDTALCYRTQDQVGRAVIDSGVARKDIFITSKLAQCGGGAQGYKEALAQQAENLKQLQVEYVDLLLIHWPGPPVQGPDPLTQTMDPDCQKPDRDGRWKACRQATWRGLLEIFKMGTKGGSRAVGVSNFEEDHLMDLIDVGGAQMMPSVNQIEVQPWWHEDDLFAVNTKLGIVSQGYSPLGTPDFEKEKNTWNVSVFTDPTLTKIAGELKVSNVAVVLRWELQKGVSINPRTKNPAHQVEDLSVADASFTALSAAQMAAIDAIHPNPRDAPVYKVCPDPKPLK